MKSFKNFFLVSVSLISTIIILELFLIFFYPQPLSGSWRTQNENGLWLNIKNSSSKHEFLERRIKFQSGTALGNIIIEFTKILIINPIEKKF